MTATRQRADAPEEPRLRARKLSRPAFPRIPRTAFPARWEGEPGDEALLVTTPLGERVAARRTALRHPWRIVAEWDEYEQLAAIRCEASREQIVRVVETLWRVGLSGGRLL